jgi:hypothetical protein
MAKFNEILAGRYNRALQKLFGMKGEVPSPQLSSEVNATVTFFWGVEMRYLEAWQRFGETFLQGAVAAQNSAVKFRNPAGSNVIAVLEKLVIFEATADTFFIDNSGPDTDLTGASGGHRMDSRGSQNSTLLVSGGNNVATATTVYGTNVQASIPLDVIVFEEQEIPILPGDNLLIRSLGVNVAIRVSFMWRERFLEESERT